MARAHYWQYVLNSEGQSVDGVTVTVYDETPSIVTLYTSKTGVSTDTSVVTENGGFFEFWIGDLTEGDGYDTNTTFSINISGATIDETTLTDIKFNFPSPRIFNETSVDWTPDGTTYTRIIVHNLNTLFPIIQVYNNILKETVPYTYKSIDETMGTITLTSPSFDPLLDGVHVVMAGILLEV